MSGDERLLQSLSDRRADLVRAEWRRWRNEEELAVSGSDESLAKQLSYAKSSLSKVFRGQRDFPHDVLKLLFAQARTPLELRREIENLNHDCEDTRSMAKRTVIERHPFNAPWVPQRLVGQERLLEEVSKLVVPPDSQREVPLLVALLGPPGVGKTRLAVEVYSRFRALDAGARRTHWWLAASSRMDLLDGLKRFADHRRLSGADSATAVDIVKGHLFESPDWLLVIDGAAGHEEIGDLLPPGNGAILLTSSDDRWRDLADHAFDVHPLDEDEAARLLGRWSGLRPTAPLRSLARDLWGMPLLLGQAAIDLRGLTAKGVEAFGQSLRSRTLDVLAGLPAVPGYPTFELPTSGLAMYESRFERLSDPATTELDLCTWLKAGAAPVRELVAVARTGPLRDLAEDPHALRQATDELRKQGLATGSPASLDLHSITIGLRRAWNAKEGPRVPVSTAREILVAVTPRDVLDGDRIDGEKTYTGHGYEVASHQHTGRADLRRRLDLLTRLVAIHRTAYTFESAATVSSTIKELERELPRDDSVVVAALVGRARLDSERWQDDVALQASAAGLLALAADITPTTRASRHRRGEVLHEAGVVLHKRAKRDEAREVLLDAVAHLSPPQRGRAWVLAAAISDLAPVLSELGEHSEARRRAVDALHLERRIHPSHPLVGVRMHNVAYTTYKEAADERDRRRRAEILDAALDEARTALAFSRRSHGNLHPFIGHRVRLAAQIYSKQGRHARALTLLQLAEKVMCVSYRSDHAEVTHIVAMQSDELFELGDLEAARVLAVRVLEEDERAGSQKEKLRDDRARIARIDRQISATMLS